MIKTNLLTFERIYDSYCPMLYGIALEISPSDRDAEKIIILTFEKVYLQQKELQSYSSLRGGLIRILVQTAQQFFKPAQLSHNPKWKAFVKTPIINELLYQQTA